MMDRWWSKSDYCMSVVTPDQLRRVLQIMLDEQRVPVALRHPLGSRAVHREHPYTVRVTASSTRLSYEPGEATSSLFGGNSNWRGPVWMPVNYF